MLSPYYQQHADYVSISREQGCRFAKCVADDYNPPDDAVRLDSESLKDHDRRSDGWDEYACAEANVSVAKQSIFQPEHGSGLVDVTDEKGPGRVRIVEFVE